MGTSCPRENWLVLDRKKDVAFNYSLRAMLFFGDGNKILLVLFSETQSCMKFKILSVDKSTLIKDIYNFFLVFFSSKFSFLYTVFSSGNGLFKYLNWLNFCILQIDFHLCTFVQSSLGQERNKQISGLVQCHEDFESKRNCSKNFFLERFSVTENFFFIFLYTSSPFSLE